MSDTTQDSKDPGMPAIEDFGALLEESLKGRSSLERSVAKGKVLAIENDIVLVDVGLKSEGRIPLREFAEPDGSPEINVGDEVEVYVERLEDRNGEAVLSREKARREEAWEKLEQAFKGNERVTGVIFGRVKGGFTVDLSGAVAFLPGSQVDIRPVRDITPLLGTPQPFMILKMDRNRGNIVVSRRSVLEETRAAERTELVANLKEGQVLQGVVKNITDYGAFVDLGGVDGLLHVTDISWRRITHPSEALQVGATVEVQVIRFNPETQRISLGMKQLEADPWDGVESKYPQHTKYTGRVTNITDYGAFVELEAGIEGLVHVSEMSWTKKNIHPGKIVSTSQEVEVMVLDVDPAKRRISLGLKQCLSNPWKEFAEAHSVGAELEGEVRNITEFGLFVGLPGEIDGMVHLSDLGWRKSGEEALADFKKGDTVKVKVLDVDLEKERVSLGIKQLSGDPMEQNANLVKKGNVVTCTVAAITDGGIEVTLVGGELRGFIKRGDLSRDRSEQRPDRFATGDKVDAKVTQVDKSSRRITLSIKAREIEEEKKAMKEYGSSDSGASLGDILGAALAEKEAASGDAGGKEEVKAKPKTKAKAKAKDETEEAANDEPEADSKPKSKAKAKAAEDKDLTDDEAEAKPKSTTKAKSKDETQAKAEPKAKPKTKAKKEAENSGDDPDAGDSSDEA